MKVLFAVVILALWRGCVPMAVAAEPDQAARWSAASVNPRDSIRLDKAVALYVRNEARYGKIGSMRSNGVPAPVLFCLHMRESDNNFRCHPHEGSPLNHRTRFVPKGRIPAPAEPPFTFEQSAEDAYYVCDRLDLKDWRHLAPALQAMESFNGLGYQHPGKPPSPYLWAATTIERPGKYVADGRFSPTARDEQLGCAAVLKRMQSRGISIPFAPRSSRIFFSCHNHPARHGARTSSVFHPYRIHHTMSTIATKLAAAAKSYLQRYKLRKFVGEPEIATLARGLVAADGSVVMEADGATPAVTLGGAQTLTNKTLKASTTLIVDASDITKALGFILSGATTAFKTTLAFVQTAARTITFPDATDTLVGRATTDTLTNKLVIETAQALSGAGAVDVVTGVTRLTTTGAAQALTIADGVAGQVKRIIHEVDGGSAVLTPTTKTGYTTITFTNVGDSAEIVFLATRGWMITSLHGAVAA